MELLESYGVVPKDMSLSLSIDESLTAHEEDLKDCVNKLVKQLEAKSIDATSSAINRIKKAQEERVIQLQSDCEEMRANNHMLQQQLKELNELLKAENDDHRRSSLEIEKLRLQSEQLSQDLVVSQRQVNELTANNELLSRVANDNNKSDNDVLAEENIELMQENKELRKEKQKLQMTLDKLQRGNAPLQPVPVLLTTEAATENFNPLNNDSQSISNSNRKRAFGVDITASTGNAVIDETIQLDGTAKAGRRVRNKPTGVNTLSKDTPVTDSNDVAPECVQS